MGRQKLTQTAQKFLSLLENGHLDWNYKNKNIRSSILPETLNSASYVQFLAENLPDFPEEILLLNRSKIIFQQDAAGPRQNCYKFFKPAISH